MKFKDNTEHIHKLISLTSSLNYQLRQAEETRKEISKLSLRIKRKSRLQDTNQKKYESK